MEQVNQVTKRTRRTSKQISVLLTRYHTSGLSPSEFCERNRIHKSNFYKWISRSKKKVTGKKTHRSAFAEVQITSSQNSIFAEVNGIRIYQPVAASYLKELKG